MSAAWEVLSVYHCASLKLSWNANFVEEQGLTGLQRQQTRLYSLSTNRQCQTGSARIRGVALRIYK